MILHATSERAHDSDSTLVLARPEKRFVPSYIAALREGMEASRHRTTKEEIKNLKNGDVEAWRKFAETCPNAVGTDNFCLEDMFWLTKDDLFIGFVVLRSELAPLRATYGGNTGRVLRPSERGKGYGTIGLQLTKALAERRGFDELVMVTAADNWAARRPWEKCGAQLIEEFTETPKSYWESGAVKYRLALTPQSKQFIFKPIDLHDPKSVAAAVLFRRDSFVHSIGDDAFWNRDSGFDGRHYIDYLAATLDNPDGFAVQVFDGQECVGQIEGRYREIDGVPVGYVNLYYLIPEYRNKGHGAALERYAAERFQNKPIQKMQLSIWHQNQSAKAFYHKQGWTMGQPRQEPGFFYMNKVVA